MPTIAEPTLFGIVNSNRQPSQHWGKNQFNSSFPVSLACYMKENAIKATYLAIDKDLKVKAVDITIDDVFNSKAKAQELFFGFESTYSPYQKYSYENIGNIDLVISHKQQPLRPLEIKLTVVPDEATHKLAEDSWGPELVVRPDSTWYCAFGMMDSCWSKRSRVREIFEPLGSNMDDWGNRHEITNRKSDIHNAVNSFQKEFHELQKPFLMQPIWKTKGKLPVLSEKAFHIFVWSDFALCRAFFDQAAKSRGNEVNRFLRSTARCSRILYELSTKEKVRIKEIYTEMAFGKQNDKEFSMSGRITRKYIPPAHIVSPAVDRTVLRQLILNGGEKKLSPERRFDQTIYFTATDLFGGLS